MPNNNNNNNDQSLINPYTNRNNNTSSNSDLYMEQMLTIFSEIHSDMSALRKEIKNSSKSDNNSVRDLTNAVNKLNSNIINQTRATEEHTKAQKQNKSNNNNDAEQKLLNKRINAISDKIRALNIVLATYTKDSEDYNETREKFIKEQVKQYEDEINYMKNHTEEEIEIRDNNNKLLNEILSKSEKTIKDLEDNYANKNVAFGNAIAALNKEIQKATGKEEAILRKRLEQLKKQEKLELDRHNLEISRNNFNKHIDKLNADLENKRIASQQANINRLNSVANSIRNIDELKDNESEKQKRIGKLQSYGELRDKNDEISETTNLFANERNLALDRIEKAIIAGNEIEENLAKTELESLNNNIKNLTDKGIDSDYNSVMNKLSASSSLNSLLAPTRAQQLIESLLGNSDSLNTYRTERDKNDTFLANANDLKESGNLTDEQRKNLDEQIKVTEKENQSIDYITSQFEEMFANIAAGNKSAAKRNERNIKKEEENLKRMRDLPNIIGESVKDTLNNVSQAYGPRGTIMKFVSKAISTIGTEVLNYNRELQVNALNSLESAYEGAGMNVAQQNLLTRDEIQSMMRDIGADLEAQNIKGVNTSDVLNMAESVANAGVLETNALTDMSEAFAKIAAINPNMKSSFTDENMIRHYFKMYQELGSAGFESYLYTQAESVYGASQAVDNAFWAVNGRLVELENTLINTKETFGLTTSEMDNLRTSTYALAAVVGTDTTDFNAWINDFLDIAKNPIRDDTKSIISGLTYGDQILEAIENQDYSDVMFNAYKSLLEFGYSSETGFTTGYGELAKQLGIDAESLEKIRNDAQYKDESGNFDITKFEQAFQKALTSAQTGEDFNEKMQKIVVEGQGLTKKQEDANRVMNEMTGNFVDLVGFETDPEAVKHEIAAINFAADSINEGISAAADLLLGGLESLGSGSGLSSGLSALGNLAGGAGAAGPVAAGIAAFGGGLMIGDWLNKKFKLSERFVAMMHEDLEESPLITSQNYLAKHMDELREAISPMTEELKSINGDLDNLVTQEHEDKKIEEANKVKTSVEAGKFDFSKMPMQKQYKDKDGNLISETEYNSLSEDEKSNYSVHSSIKSQNELDWANASANFDQASAILAAELSTASNDEERQQIKQSQMKQLKELGVDDKTISAFYSDDLSTYGDALGVTLDEGDRNVAGWEAQIKAEKLKLDEFNATQGQYLYQVYKRSQELIEEGTSEVDAWNNAFSEIIGKGNDTLSKYKADTSKEAPKEGIDFEIDESNGRLLIKAGAYTRPEADDSVDLGNNMYKDRNWGRFATGLDEVPYDAYPALLDKGEMVLTSTQADYYKNKLEYANVDNQPVVDSINGQTTDIIHIISNAISLLQVIARNTGNFNSNYVNNSDSYLVDAISNGVSGLSSYLNPAIYK